MVLSACAGSAASEPLKGTEQEINSAFSNQVSPVISGDRIVWQDEREGNWDIYMYDMSVGRTESALFKDSKDEIEPAISGNRIVVSDNRKGNYDIYMYDIGTKTKTQITSDRTDQKESAISNFR